jgi:hypothetical protein
MWNQNSKYLYILFAYIINSWQALNPRAHETGTYNEERAKTELRRTHARTLGWTAREMVQWEGRWGDALDGYRGSPIDRPVKWMVNTPQGLEGGHWTARELRAVVFNNMEWGLLAPRRHPMSRCPPAHAAGETHLKTKNVGPSKNKDHDTTSPIYQLQYSRYKNVCRRTIRRYRVIPTDTISRFNWHRHRVKPTDIVIPTDR